MVSRFRAQTGHPLTLAAAAIILILALLLIISDQSRVFPYPPPVAQSTSLMILQEVAVQGGQFPNLEDFWSGLASFTVDVPDTGLPMGESETLAMANGELWSYVHASDRSAGVIDQCGDPVEFPGCMVIYKSRDGGVSFTLDEQVCQVACNQCPCEADRDHHVQQQYPRLMLDETNQTVWGVYEYLGRPMVRQSRDGLSWGQPQRVNRAGLWSSLEGCGPAEKINSHPFALINTEQCLAGGPPGIWIEDETVYIFVGLGQSPGGLGCFVGRVDQQPGAFQRCRSNPLLTGSPTYGPLDLSGVEANPYWNYRMLSSATVDKIGSQYYMLYEGIRGPGRGDPGDTQFGIGLARTIEGKIDGAWEQYPLNPIILDLPANIGAGHADIVVLEGITYLYTSLDGVTRSRLRLEWDR
ncbi:MAG: hypothetical protein AAF633_15020 [Chloroflexota bacterium]